MISLQNLIVLSSPGDGHLPDQADVHLLQRLHVLLGGVVDVDDAAAQIDGDVASGRVRVEGVHKVAVRGHLRLHVGALEPDLALAIHEVYL